jgi:hypothetical protein
MRAAISLGPAINVLLLDTGTALFIRFVSPAEESLPHSNAIGAANSSAPALHQDQNCHPQRPKAHSLHTSGLPVLPHHPRVLKGHGFSRAATAFSKIGLSTPEGCSFSQLPDAGHTPLARDAPNQCRASGATVKATACPERGRISDRVERGLQPVDKAPLRSGLQARPTRPSKLPEAGHPTGTTNLAACGTTKMWRLCVLVSENPFHGLHNLLRLAERPHREGT